MILSAAYKGRDPLAEVIDEAHKHNIAVIPWFEFGFSSSYNDGGGHILRAKPHWAARDREGRLLKKNGFEWMNAFHPEVQEFMLALVTEVVKRYDVDGVQGDDRLPAQPIEGGYDSLTVALYKETHAGIGPPLGFSRTALEILACGPAQRIRATTLPARKSLEVRCCGIVVPEHLPMVARRVFAGLAFMDQPGPVREYLCRHCSSAKLPLRHRTVQAHT